MKKIVNNYMYNIVKYKRNRMLIVNLLYEYLLNLAVVDTVKILFIFAIANVEKLLSIIVRFLFLPSLLIIIMFQARR